MMSHEQSGSLAASPAASAIRDTHHGPASYSALTSSERLDAACRAVAGHDWSIEHNHGAAALAAEALRTEVIAFVIARKAEQAPPERVLVELKGAVNALLLTHGYAGDQRVLRKIVFTAFLSAYYDDARVMRSRGAGDAT